MFCRKGLHAPDLTSFVVPTLKRRHSVFSPVVDDFSPRLLFFTGGFSYHARVEMKRWTPRLKPPVEIFYRRFFKTTACENKTLLQAVVLTNRL
jgi:hypothetical protein